MTAGLRKLVRLMLGRRSARPFQSSAHYWEERYRVGGSSGAGSYGRLARFKADILNDFVTEHGIESVIELGCGDGNQLSLSAYPHYVGVDVSKTALEACRARFEGDPTKAFLEKVPDGPPFDLALSLDVIYHLVEDDLFHAYMTELFNSSKAWVVIYASNIEQNEFVARFGDLGVQHVKHRRFTDWVRTHQRRWRLERVVPNRFPYEPSNPIQTSFADFFFFTQVRPAAESS